jgi:hypothetical protein
VLPACKDTIQTQEAEKNSRMGGKSAFLGWEWGFWGAGIGKNTDQKRAQTNYK